MITIIRDGAIVTADLSYTADVPTHSGKIAAIGTGLAL